MRAPRSGCSAAIFVADGHEPGHFRLGDFDLLAAPVGQRQILDEIVGLSFHGCIHDDSLRMC